MQNQDPWKNNLLQPAPTSYNNQSLAKQKKMSNIIIRLNHVEIQLLNFSFFTHLFVDIKQAECMG